MDGQEMARSRDVGGVSPRSLRFYSAARVSSPDPEARRRLVTRLPGTSSMAGPAISSQDPSVVGLEYSIVGSFAAAFQTDTGERKVMGDGRRPVRIIWNRKGTSRGILTLSSKHEYYI